MLKRNKVLLRSDLESPYIDDGISIQGDPTMRGRLFDQGLAQSVERLTAEREVAGSIPGAGPILRVLNQLRNEGTPFAVQTGRPSRGSDDHVKWRSRPQ